MIREIVIIDCTDEKNDNLKGTISRGQKLRNIVQKFDSDYSCHFFFRAENCLDSEDLLKNAYLVLLHASNISLERVSYYKIKVFCKVNNIGLIEFSGDPRGNILPVDRLITNLEKTLLRLKSKGFPEDKKRVEDIVSSEINKINIHEQLDILFQHIFDPLLLISNTCKRFIAAHDNLNSNSYENKEPLRFNAEDASKWSWFNLCFFVFSDNNKKSLSIYLESKITELFCFATGLLWEKSGDDNLRRSLEVAFPNDSSTQIKIIEELTGSAYSDLDAICDEYSGRISKILDYATKAKKKYSVKNILFPESPLYSSELVHFFKTIRISNKNIIVLFVTLLIEPVNKNIVEEHFGNEIADAFQAHFPIFLNEIDTHFDDILNGEIIDEIGTFLTLVKDTHSELITIRNGLKELSMVTQRELSNKLARFLILREKLNHTYIKAKLLTNLDRTPESVKEILGNPKTWYQVKLRIKMLFEVGTEVFNLSCPDVFDILRNKIERTINWIDEKRSHLDDDTSIAASIHSDCKNLSDMISSMSDFVYFGLPNDGSMTEQDLVHARDDIDRSYKRLIELLNSAPCKKSKVAEDLYGLNKLYWTERCLLEKRVIEILTKLDAQQPVSIDDFRNVLFYVSDTDDIAEVILAINASADEKEERLSHLPLLEDVFSESKTKIFNFLKK